MQLNVPMVLTKHGTVFPAGLAAFIDVRLARHSSVICVSEEVLKLYREWQDCSHESAYHIPNGLDLWPYDVAPNFVEARRRLGWSLNALVVKHQGVN